MRRGMPWSAALLVDLGCGWPITTQLKQMILETNTSLGYGLDLSTMTFGPRKRTRFGTWNIRTLVKTTTLAQLTKEFRKYHLEILGLSEVRWPGVGEKRTSTGEFLIFSGKPAGEHHANGVGFLLSKSARKSLLDWQAISDRIIIARFKSAVRQVVFVQVYAPTEQATSDEKDAFYLCLNNSLDHLRKSDIVILMGDLNAKVGSDNSDWEHVMGRHGLGSMNDNGERFADLCSDRNLVIGGTIFPHKNIHKATWTSPDRMYNNQIDHIAISRKWRTSLLDVSNRRAADVYSDHYLVVGSVRLKLAVPTITRRQTIRKPAIASLKDPEVKLQLVSRIQQSLTEIETQTVTSKWEKTVNAYTEAASTILGYPDKTRKDWISDNTWNIIRERQSIKVELNAASGATRTTLAQKYRDLDRKVGRSARNDKRAWLSELATLAQQAADSRQYSTVYQLTRKLANKKHHINYPVKAIDGSLILMEEQQLTRWTEHFSNVLNCTSPGTSTSPPMHPNRLLTISVAPPTLDEIRTAIRSLKPGKAAGNDNIYAELLQADVELSTRTMHAIYQDIWESETIPSSIKEGLIVKLPKKGDLSNCENWRGITLLNSINKIISSIIARRLQNAFEPVLRNEQAGFRPNRSCTDQINTLRIIIEQSVEYRTPLYMVFVDFQRAFDSVGRNMMWQILSSYGVPEKLINIIKELYRDSTCRVIHNGNLGIPFNIYSGVKQGCTLSPLLFIIVVDWVMKKVTRTPSGLPWNIFHRLEDLDYADDICLLSQSLGDMERKLNSLQFYANQVGLKINVSKTKLLRVNASGACNLSIDGQQIEEVEKFCYLGSWMSKDGGADTDVRSRVNKARHTYSMLNNIWSSTQISRNLKLTIFRSNVLSVLLYGCETWKVTESTATRLQVFVNKCLRRILRVKWPETITNQDLWRVTQQEEIAITIRRRKWSWIGHTLRKPANDITKLALDWNPQGSRRVGRPSRTWKRTIEEEARSQGTEWRLLKPQAINRVRWRAFVEALCSQAE